MQRLTDLRTLSLDDNKFTHLPNPVLSYYKLYSLSLRRNQLESLPEGVFIKLPEIETLAVDGNRLMELPTSLKTLKKLKKVTYAGNPLSI